MDTNPERPATRMTVYLLLHSHLLPQGEEDVKILGVYSTHADASSAQQRALSEPGFKEHASGFTIDEYEIGKEHWEEGFRTISAD